MKEHNFLYLIWKDPQSRRNYTVGKLSKTVAGYSFQYCNEYQEAQNAGWMYIQAFPEVKKYESTELFPVFSSRLPDKKRKNIKQILDKYGLEEYDGYELLKQSGGRLPIDTYEFVDPIFDEDKTIQREFYIVGIRHVCACVGKDCSKRPHMEIGMKLALHMDPTNEYDPYSVQVSTKNGTMLGYIPRYYSQSICERLNKGMTYDCTIKEINTVPNCQECIKVKLFMPKVD